MDFLLKAVRFTALFAVPLIILEPVKPIAAYLIATGQIAAGITVLAAGEILKVIIERLFKLCRRKLLNIPLFARVFLSGFVEMPDSFLRFPILIIFNRWLTPFQGLPLGPSPNEARRSATQLPVSDEK